MSKSINYKLKVSILIKTITLITYSSFNNIVVPFYCIVYCLLFPKFLFYYVSFFLSPFHICEKIYNI